MSGILVDSQELSPLPRVLRHGLVAVATCGFVSFFFSVLLFLFLTYQLISWRRQAGSKVPTNQFLVLVYNLVLADIQQAMAFLLSVNSLIHDKVEVGTSTCWAQGWFVSTGDLASSVFIFAIAVHTFMGVVKGYRLPSRCFYSAIVGLWIFVYGLAVLGAIMHPRDIYVRAGAWCWINHDYQPERLWLHYFWMFVAMFATILLYGGIIVTLRRRSANSSQLIPHGATPMMIMYPTIYTICTIPLAAGRIASMAGRDVDLAYFCVAGSMIACNGWLDVLLYSLTRKRIVFSEAPPGEDFGIGTFWGMEQRQDLGTTTTVEGPRRKSSLAGLTEYFPHMGRKSSAGGFSGNGSMEDLRGITVQETVSVREEFDTDQDAFEMRMQEQRKAGSQDGIDNVNWLTGNLDDF